MRVDAYHHLWDLKAVHYPWLTARGEPRFFGDPTSIQRDYLVGEFRGDASANGFQASVHIQVGVGDPFREAQWIDSIAISNPGWPAAQVAFCDLTQDDAEEKIHRLASFASVHGVRQIVGRSPQEDELTGSNRLLLDNNFLSGLQTVAAKNMTFDLQLIPSLMGPAAELFAKIPELPFVLCHAGSPYDLRAEGFRLWKRGLIEISKLPNAACKLSGYGMFKHDWTTPDLQSIVEACLDCFGPERCMYGSNFPVDSLYSTYSEIVSAYEKVVPSEMHEAFFGKKRNCLLQVEGSQQSMRIQQEWITTP